LTQRCGLVAVLGAPNAGKSTLVNALVGQKVAIVSPKAQTTRARLMGIAIEGDAQMNCQSPANSFRPCSISFASISAVMCEGSRSFMPGLVPGIHVLLHGVSKTWMAGKARP